MIMYVPQNILITIKIKNVINVVQTVRRVHLQLHAKYVILEVF